MIRYTLARTPYVRCLLTISALAIYAGSANAGIFVTSPLTGDADSGISAAKTYTHAFDMNRTGSGDGGALSINGVPFTAGGNTSGTDANFGGTYTATGLTNALDGHVTGVTGGIGDAIDDFFYRSGGGRETVTLSGLTPGSAYKTVFYTSDGYGGNPQTITFSDTLQQATGVVRNAGRIEYTYAASDAGDITYTFDSEASGSFHQYAFTNEAAPSAVLPIIANIPGLFNTGVDGSGNALGDNVDDPHYALVADPSGLGDATVTDDNFPISGGPGGGGPWLANGPDFRWIGPADGGDANGPAGNYAYRTTFDLTGLEASTAIIAGAWSADDGGVDILLNGLSVGAGQLATGFDSLTEFRLDASALPPGAFAKRLNTLDFVVNNGGTSASPTGLLVQGIEGRALVHIPEPSTLALAVLGLLGLTLLGRRRKR